MRVPDKVWIVDDEAAVRATYSYVLKNAGYHVAECENGLQALGRLEQEQPLLVVLDIEMPGLNGWKTLAELRRHGCTRPVLVLTHLNDEDSRVRGLEEGADDFIAKPCSARELLARVRALLRRAAPATSRKPLRFGEVVIDLETKTAKKKEAPLRLSRTDYALLELLHESRGKLVSRDLILQRIWHGHSGGSHALDTHLWRLRKKLGDPGDETGWIRNVPGIGYVMTPGE